MIMIKLAAAVLGCLVLCVPTIASPQEHRGPSTPEERKKVLETIHGWQSDPLGPQAKDNVGSVLKWFAKFPTSPFTSA